MTMVRYSMVKQLNAATPDVNIKVTYGAATKLARRVLNVKKLIPTMHTVWASFIQDIGATLSITRNVDVTVVC